MNLGDEIATIAQRILERPRIGAKNIAALCPFHVSQKTGTIESTPSFSMSRETGLWHCFACHEKGNLRHLLKAAGVSYQRIQDEYGPLLEEVARAIPKRLDPLRPNVLAKDPIPESLLGIFHAVPLSLEAEGFTEATLAKFDVGFDSHHMRITYPLRDMAGQLIGISGRAVNYDPNTLRYKLYDREYSVWGLPQRLGSAAERRTVLWNVDRLYPSLRGVLYPDVVVVEGFKACMRLDQAGVKSVVALLGSYMSEEQQWILEAMGARVYLMLDNNEAGQKGTRYIGKRLARGLDVRVIEYRRGEEKAQPSDLTVNEIIDAFNTAVDFYRWRHPRK
jgi:DNA primase